MPAKRWPRIEPMGDAAVLVELGQRVDTALNTRALALAGALRGRRGVREVVPGYASVVVLYDPEQLSPKTLASSVRRLVAAKPSAATPGRLHRIPVEYDGPDVKETAHELGITVEQLVRLHSEPVYRCFMVGFVPGWAYLGPLPEALRLPRRRVPRTHVPAGSVAVAGDQTGVYSLPSPGGWHLIGRTSVRMFLPDSDPPCLLRTGDRVKFFPA
jgi:inhibitor of KinA